MNFDDNHIPSPCVELCTLDLDDICLGCRRHIDEIIGWHTASNQQKQQILANISSRRQLDKNDWARNTLLIKIFYGINWLTARAYLKSQTNFSGWACADACNLLSCFNVLFFFNEYIVIKGIGA